MPHDPKLVEAVAQAIHSNVHIAERPWKWASDATRKGFLSDATAALDAIEAAGCVVVPKALMEAIGSNTEVMLAIVREARIQAEAIESRLFSDPMVAARPGAQP